ncbi:MAG: methyltransferase domain-containing protein [Oligoflexia bacterium]|nr:methyltransferase domain-containing protein [Oligoflexia bacterium]
MKHQLKRTTERIGDIEIQIECLEDLNRTIDELFEELERTGRPELLEELCPYFGTVWPSARALAEAIVKARPEGMSILELGCGLALPSLAAAKAGARVVATDFHPEVPEFLARNIALNWELDSVARPAIEYIRTDWSKGNFPGGPFGGFDRVIGSDVLYERQQVPLLARAIQATLADGGEAWIADPARPYLQSFVDEMRASGFAHETQIRVAADTVNGLPVSKEIFIVRLWKNPY